MSDAYSFNGICELIAVTSCDAQVPDFSVRVDFRSEDDANGAIGVRIGNLRWVSRENGDFDSTADEDASSSTADIFDYPDQNVTVILNSTTQTNRIVVTGNIQVTVTHVYSGKLSMWIYNSL
jgi:hypothetical protein